MKLLIWMRWLPGWNLNNGEIWDSGVEPQLAIFYPRS